MAGALWEGLLGLVLIAAWGGLLALAAWVLPRLSELVEPGAAPTRFGLEEWGAPPGPVPPAPEARPAPPPPPPRPPVRTEEPAEPLVAAAIALALDLYHRAGVQALPLPPREASAGNPWSLAGRWQAMQARLHLRKR